MGDRLKDRIAVVTGAGRGIGRGIAIALAQEGAKVVVNDFGGKTDGFSEASTLPADEVVKEIRNLGGTALANYDSVASPEGGDNIINTAVNSFGKIDILVNNAGNNKPRMIFNMTPGEWDAVMKVHLYGAFYCTRPAAALMRQYRWGRIINISSGSAWMGIFGGTNYSAAKAGLFGFTRGCALELARYNITVNCIGPGAATRLSMERAEGVKSRGKEEYTLEGASEMSTSEVQACYHPDDCAPIVVYLATEAAANINGYWFNTRGGEISLNCTPSPIKSIFKQGRWALDELLEIMPTTLAAGLEKPKVP